MQREYLVSLDIMFLQKNMNFKFQWENKKIKNVSNEVLSFKEIIQIQ